MSSGQGPNSSLGDQCNRGPQGPMGNIPMGQRHQYPYGPGYERRYTKSLLFVNKKVFTFFLFFWCYVNDAINSNLSCIA